MSEMSVCWQRRGGKLGLASWLVVGGAIALETNCAVAQITPDTTLPNNSRVTPDGNTSIIEGGTQAGGNLFHSFAQFSVPTGSSAHFNNAADVQNIISRVTGGSVSNIDGLISANGTANLFLINPSGIVFGPNASLNIGGSFVASTASSLKFADGSQFSATPAQSAPLLTISVPIGLQYGANPGSIQVQGNGQGLRLTTELIDTTSGLKVQPNQTLALVGGDVSLEGATLKTPGGRIELGSVTGVGLVSLTPTSKGFSLGYDQVQNFGNIQLSQQAALDSSGQGGGDIQVWGKSVTLTNGSQIEASTLGVEQGGNLVVNAQDSVQLIGISADKKFPSGLFANAYPSVTGAAGNLTINTRELLVRDGGQVSASTYGAGNAGNVTVRADSVQLIGASSIDPQSRSTLLSETYSTGAAGNLTINTRELLVQNGAYVGARTYSAGNAGNLTVNANSVQLTGNSPRGAASALIVTSEKPATGAGGNLTINTSKLSLEDGAQVSTGTSSPLKGGDLTVRADSVQVIGTSTDNVHSSLNTNAFSTATGAAGNLTINTRELLVRDGGQVSASSEGAGNAGNITVRADSVQLIGASSMNSSSANGNSGDINIFTGSLDVKNGAQLNAATYGKGDAGNVNINARDMISFDRGYVYSTVEEGAIGKGGDIRITTGDLSLTNGAQLNAATYGKGDAGNVNINARDMISFDRGYVYSTVEEGAIGKGGDIRITTGDLSLTNGAQLNATTYGKGDGGSVIIDARKSVSLDGVFDGTLPSAVFGGVGEGGEGKGGGIHITTDELSVTNGAQLQASTGGIGDAGNMIIDARKSVSFDGVIVGKFYTFNSYAASRVYDNAQGKGGNIHITTGEISLTNGAQVFSDTSGKGDAGNIQINAKNSVSVSGTSLISGSSSALFTFTNSTDKGGNIIVDTSAFRTLDGGVLNAQTFNDGDGGSITVRAKLVEVLNGGQLLATSSGNGRAGKITVNAAEMIVNGSDATYLDRVEKFGIKVANAFGTKGVNNVNADSGLFVRSESLGSAGDIEVTSPQIRLENQGRFIAESASGNGGNITLGVGDLLLLRRGSLISATAGTDKLGGNGGNITINVPNGFIVAAPKENSDITANAFSGSGGRVTIDATGIFGMTPRSREDLVRLLGANPDPQRLPTNDITAISQTNPNLSGTVTVNTLGIDPTQGLVSLPVIPVDTKVAQGCTASGTQAQSEFIITGRGGLPPNPGEPLSTDAVSVDLVTLPNKEAQHEERNSATQSQSHTREHSHKINFANPPTQIVEAQGWIVNKNGDVELVAFAPTATPHNRRFNPASCQQERK